MKLGHITNYTLGPNFAEKELFDSSMPLEHYEAIKASHVDKSSMFTIRVNNISDEIRYYSN